MKVKSVLILLISLITFIYACNSKGKSNFIDILNSAKKQLPTLVKEIENSKACNTSELRPICSQGFKYWSSHSEAQYFRGIPRDFESMNTFYDILFEYLPVEKDDLTQLRTYILSMISFIDLIEAINIDLAYSKKTTSKGCYFSMLLEHNCEDSTQFDFLFTAINSGFKLEADLFLLDQGKGNLISGTVEQKMVRNDANLSREMYTTLVNILQLGAFDAAIDLIDSIED